MAKKLTVAAIQMISSANLADNLRAAERLIKNASDQGAAVVALPEYFCLMGLADTDKVKVRESFGDGPIQDALQNLSLI
ncbi:MAG: carbon-nitrogen hydrolase family protein, partial [Burkholderiaceae bacterium]|nr:carbon-nitrogen hydrolase family protein [Burkholderiaceae bacterium]